MVDKKQTFSQTLRKINGNFRKIKKDFIKLLIFLKKIAVIRDMGNILLGIPDAVSN